MPVSDPTAPRIKALVADMIETLEDIGGAGLAAPQVHVSERDGAVHPQTHFGLVVDDFDAVVSRVSAAGASWEEQPDLFGGRRGFTRDPAGNRIELLEPAGQLA